MCQSDRPEGTESLPSAKPKGTCIVFRVLQDGIRAGGRTVHANLPHMVLPPDRQLLDYLAAYDSHVASLFLALREIVLEEAPAAIESISMGYALAIGFSFTGKPLKDGFCHIVACKSWVNLGFNRGTLLPDPGKALVGTGKLIRHLRINNHDDLDRPLVRRFLRAAIEQVGQVASPLQLISAKAEESATKRTGRPK